MNISPKSFLNTTATATATTALLIALPVSAAQNSEHEEKVALISGKAVHYSPWAKGGARSNEKVIGRDAYLGSDSGSPKHAYFGDTHVHTSYSADAAFVGNTLGPDIAYRFAKGEEVVAAPLLRPL